MTRCAICDDEIEPGNGTQIEADDDPYDSFNDEAVAHLQCLRRHRAAVEQVKRMFEDKPKGPHQPEPPREIDEDDLDEEIEEIEEYLDELLDEE